MDLIDDPTPGGNAPEFSVTELSSAIKRMIEGEFGHVRIRGEVGRVTRARSGHLYFDLKDDRAVISAVSWKGQAARLATQPEEGMEVVAVGKLTTFPGQSRYQLVVEELRVAGVGALMAMLEKRKKALAAEGLFAPERKRPIPYLPKVIGVVTSPTGAVIRDILHRLRDRFPRQVLVWPVVVQGEACAGQVARAIEGFNRMAPGGVVPRPDLLIVARGGGSIEDLWGFNEEIVARAAAASDIPLISAVGHETDTTLIDYVADRRAPTPTAAAEMAVPVRGELMGTLAAYEERRLRAMREGLRLRGQRLRDLSRALPRPDEIVGMQAQRLDVLGARLPRALEAATARARRRLLEQGAGLRPGVLRQAVERKSSETQRLADRFETAANAGLERRKTAFTSLEQRLRPGVLERAVADRRDLLRRVSGAFGRAGKGQISKVRDRLNGLDRLHESLGYQKTLERGYAVVRDGDGQLVSDAQTAQRATELEIQFHDGRVRSGALAEKPAAPKRPAKKPRDGGQGSLF